MSRTAPIEPLDEFVRRVWHEDVAPLLRDRRAAQRRATARVGGRMAASAGLLLDGLLGLRGKPFTRFMTVVGSSLAAMVPDVLDWNWLGESADEADRIAADQQLRRRVAALEETEALRLFGLTECDSFESLRRSWRAAARRWHPDQARSPVAAAEHRLRFVAYQAAYGQLKAAYESGRLPRGGACSA